MFRTDRESVFICRVIKHFILSGPTGEKITDIPENLDWTRIDDFLLHYNLQPMFYETLASSAIDPQREADWRQMHMANLRRNLLTARVAARLFQQCRRENIPAVALRGLHLGHFIYPDPGARPMRDVDILVQSDRDSLRRLMVRLQARPYQNLRTQDVFILDETIFEIHYTFLSTKRYRSVMGNRFFIDQTNLRKTPDGDSLACLSCEAEFISVVTHAFIHHDLDRVMPLVDIALLMNLADMDWDFIADWCRQARLQKMFLFTLSFVNALFDLGKNSLCIPFGGRLPGWEDEAFRAFWHQIQGKNRLTDKRIRSRVQLYVAETAALKARQWLRFLSLGEIRSYSRILFKTKMTRIGGSETAHESEDVGRHRIESRI